MTERQEAPKTTKDDSWESRVITTGHNTLPTCNQGKDTWHLQSRISIELPMYDKVCRMEILSPKKGEKGKRGYDKAASTGKVIIRVLTW